MQNDQIDQRFLVFLQDVLTDLDLRLSESECLHFGKGFHLFMRSHDPDIGKLLLVGVGEDLQQTLHHCFHRSVSVGNGQAEDILHDYHGVRFLRVAGVVACGSWNVFG
ncbi:hypothetical protein D3C85_1447360 [compost metagenome]